MNIDLETLKKIHKVYDLMTVKNNEEAYDLLGQILQEKQFILPDVVSSCLIKFNEVDEDGNMYLPNSINIESLNNLKINGQIKDFEVDKNGIKVIKDFRLESGSL